jgi:uncharacterized protein
MIVLDLNLYLYAINRDAPQYKKAHLFLEKVFSSNEQIGIPWIVILGFLRISTNPRLLPNPLTPEKAISVMEAWLHLRNICILHPSEEHWNIFVEILRPLGLAGNLTSDAHLAALCIEHGAKLFSSDNDFNRFQKLRFENPLE